MSSRENDIKQREGESDENTTCDSSPPTKENTNETKSSGKVTFANINSYDPVTGYGTKLSTIPSSSITTYHQYNNQVPSSSSSSKSRFTEEMKYHSQYPSSKPQLLHDTEKHNHHPLGNGQQNGGGGGHTTFMETTRSRRALTLESEGSNQSGSPFDFLSSPTAGFNQLAIRSTPYSSSLGGDNYSAYSGDDRSDMSVGSDRSSSAPDRRRQPDKRPFRSKRHHGTIPSPSSINYHGVTMAMAASQGNLPLCVLLWGMATAKKVNLLVPDAQGNTPFHFAALADVPEVLGFLQQQGRSRTFSSSTSRLVDARNQAGETPLLRAASTGKIPTLKYLLDEGSDPFATDLQGNTIFTILTRCGHLWGLHFVYTVVHDGYGPQVTFELLSTTDRDEKSVLHWAADLGDVNMTEYLIRRGLDPNNTDSYGRSALHAAVKNGRVDATRFLVRCGCYPLKPDLNKETAKAIAYASRNADLIAAVNVKRGKIDNNITTRGQIIRGRTNNGCCMRSCRRRSDRNRNRLEMDDGGASLIGIQGRDIESGIGMIIQRPNRVMTGPNGMMAANSVSDIDMGFPTHQQNQSSLPPPPKVPSNISIVETTSDGKLKPHAICRAKPSRLGYTIVYAFLVLGWWILTACIPFYVWLVLVCIIIALARVFGPQAKLITVNSTDGCRDFFLNFIMAREKILGVYMGMVMTCLLFWFCSLRVGIVSGFSSSATYLNSLNDISYTNPTLGAAFFSLGGLSGSTDDQGLFWATLGFLLISTMLWLKLVWFDTDPGAVYTRYQDFDIIMEECLRSSGMPPAHKYCRTTLVRKPLRSKFCTQTGMVIARMDHFCMWLNNSVGYANHRTFIVFLITQFVATALYAVMLIRALQRELGFNASACVAVSILLDEKYFFATALTGFLCIATLALATLLMEQTVNIARNITTNERLNRSRYPWMNDAQGKPFNHFDRGIFSNTLEFWHVPGFQRDYFAEFDLPQLDTDKKETAHRHGEAMNSSFLNQPGEEPAIPHVGGREDLISGVNPSPNAAIFSRSRSSPLQSRPMPGSPLASQSNAQPGIPQSRVPSYRMNGEVYAVAKAQVILPVDRVQQQGGYQMVDKQVHHDMALTGELSTLTSDETILPTGTGTGHLPHKAVIDRSTVQLTVSDPFAASVSNVSSSGAAQTPILTRTMQAQAQLEARIQKAIGLSMLTSSSTKSSAAVVEDQRQHMTSSKTTQMAPAAVVASGTTGRLVTLQLEELCLVEKSLSNPVLEGQSSIKHGAELTNISHPGQWLVKGSNGTHTPPVSISRSINGDEYLSNLTFSPTQPPSLSVSGIHTAASSTATSTPSRHQQHGVGEVNKWSIDNNREEVSEGSTQESATSRNKFGLDRSCRPLQTSSIHSSYSGNTSVDGLDVFGEASSDEQKSTAKFATLDNRSEISGGIGSFDFFNPPAFGITTAQSDGTSTDNNTSPDTNTSIQDTPNSPIPDKIPPPIKTMVVNQSIESGRPSMEPTFSSPIISTHREGKRVLGPSTSSSTVRRPDWDSPARHALPMSTSQSHQHLSSMSSPQISPSFQARKRSSSNTVYAAEDSTNKITKTIPSPAPSRSPPPPLTSMMMIHPTEP